MTIKVTEEMIDLGQMLLGDLGRNELSERETIKLMFEEMYKLMAPAEVAPPPPKQQRPSAEVTDTHRQRLKGLLIDFELPFKGYKNRSLELMETPLTFQFDENEEFVAMRKTEDLL
jgi:hypothetical protein